MNDNIINLPSKNEDSELLGEGMSLLAEACARFYEMKHKDGHALARMVDSILFYIEGYLLPDGDSVNPLPKPTHEYDKGFKYDDPA